jgi:sugar phosphate isomerase/epimerase
VNNSPEIVSLYWTTSGVFPLEGDTSRFPFRERVEAAAKAGLAGIGIWHTDLEHTLSQMSLSDMRTILDDNGVGVFELEFLPGWFVSGERKAESDRVKRLLLEASQALNAHHVKVGDFENTPCPMPQLVDSFAALCADAAEYGATIAFEFMRSATVDNLADALILVQDAGAPNGGLAVDLWHVHDLGIAYDDVRSIPARYLVSVELNDGADPGSPLYDASRARRFCGEGDYDVAGFVRAVRAAGYDGPWAVEVFSRELAVLPLDELNERMYKTTVAVVGGA